VPAVATAADARTKPYATVGPCLTFFLAWKTGPSSIAGRARSDQRGPKSSCSWTLNFASFRKLHVILDNLNTHKKNESWLKAHPNVQFHFTPTSASWLNQVEVWFSILQGQSLSGTSFTSLKQLQEHIDAYVKAYNDKAEPFVWTKKKVRQRRFKGRRITQL
jgi:hypothetical protein